MTRPTFLMFFWVLKLHSSDETYAAWFFNRLDKCRQKRSMLSRDRQIIRLTFRCSMLESYLTGCDCSHLRPCN